MLVQVLGVGKAEEVDGKGKGWGGRLWLLFRGWGFRLTGFGNGVGRKGGGGRGCGGRAEERGRGWKGKKKKEIDHVTATRTSYIAAHTHLLLPHIVSAYLYKNMKGKKLSIPSPFQIQISIILKLLMVNTLHN